MMNKYSNKLLLAMHVCFIAVVTLFVAASAGAQTTATAPAPAPAAGGPPLFIVTHDGTLQGDGRPGSPLSITASPTVSGSLTVNGDIQATNIVSASSTVNGPLTVNGNIQSNAVVVDSLSANSISVKFINAFKENIGFTRAAGSNNNEGIFARGGLLGTGVQGSGARAGSTAEGGVGVSGQGATGVNGGIGVQAFGGDASSGFDAGAGVMAIGGLNVAGNGGVALAAFGGPGSGNGNRGGTGIFAFGGRGKDGASDAFAGVFDGDVLITGKLVKGSGSFKIDHPLDPANKYLSHSFVESPDMMNIYNGVVTTDSNGDAQIQLPEYFDALNRDFRYQLTVIGTLAKTIVAEKIKDNHFRIKTNLPNVEVSWQVTGIRQDAYANTNPIPVEEDKPEAERGFYLHPEAFGQPSRMH
jgi:hypothetical protein